MSVDVSNPPHLNKLSWMPQICSFKYKNGNLSWNGNMFVFMRVRSARLSPPNGTWDWLRQPSKDIIRSIVNASMDFLIFLFFELRIYLIFISFIISYILSYIYICPLLPVRPRDKLWVIDCDRHLWDISFLNIGLFWNLCKWKTQEVCKKKKKRFKAFCYGLFL